MVCGQFRLRAARNSVKEHVCMACVKKSSFSWCGLRFVLVLTPSDDGGGKGGKGGVRLRLSIYLLVQNIYKTGAGQAAP